jgi:hypothetical protein
LVRILGSHPRDPGSSPGNGIHFFFFFLVLSQNYKKKKRNLTGETVKALGEIVQNESRKISSITCRINNAAMGTDKLLTSENPSLVKCLSWLLFTLPNNQTCNSNKELELWGKSLLINGNFPLFIIYIPRCKQYGHTKAHLQHTRQKTHYKKNPHKSIKVNER